MNARTSRLNGLLRVRRIQEEVVRARLIADTAEENRVRRGLQRAEERYAAETTPASTRPLNLADFLADRRHDDAMAGSVRRAAGALDDAVETTGMAREEWSVAAMKVTALERLEERAVEAARLEEMVAEQRAAEEVGSAIRRDAAAVRAEEIRS